MPFKTKITITCSGCFKQHSLFLGVYNRRKKSGRTDFYCSNKCYHGTTEETLLSHIDITPGYGPWGDCWKWMGTKNKKGYGATGGPNVPSSMVHRIMYIWYINRDLDKNLLVRHICDIKDCVNPFHLIEGTNADNMEDARDRQRHKRTISDEDVIFIYENHNKFTRKDLCKKFNVSESAISLIISGKARSHLYKKYHNLQ